MKLRFAEQLGNERITITLPGAVARTLDEYRAFLQQNGQGARDRKEVCAVVIATFLDTNQAFRSWKRSREQQSHPAEKRTAKSAPPVNGHAVEEGEQG